MEIQITGRHNLTVTDALRDFINDKMDKIEKFHEIVTEAHVILEVQHSNNIAEAHLKVQGVDIDATATANDMYAAIELLVNKLVTQVSKHKNKLLDKQHHRT